MSESALAAALEQGYLENCLYFAATALCCYDYFLTFDREVIYVWNGKFTFANALFYCFRYPALLNTIFVVLGYASWPSWQSTKSCVIIVRFEMAGDILILVTSALFTAMRIYAMFYRNKCLFTLVLVLGFINPAISIYTFVISTPVLVDQVCDIDTRIASNGWMIGARISSLVFDGFVMLLTWFRTRRIKLPTSDGIFSDDTVNAILIRDTAVYFGFLFLINVVGVAIGLAHLTFIEAVSTWTAILTSVLLSRLVLDLREIVTINSGTIILGETGDRPISQPLGALAFMSDSATSESDIQDEDF